MALPLDDIRKNGIAEINNIDALNKKYRMYNALSAKERRAFMVANAKKLAPYLGTSNQEKATEALYNNRNFIKRFGLQAFNSLDDGTQNSLAIRDNILQEDFKKQRAQNGNRETLINNVFKNVFGKDSNFDELSNGLDTQGKWDLLRNKNYLTNSDIKNKLVQNAKEVKEETAQKRKSLWSSFSFNNVGNTNTFELYNQNRKADESKNNQDMEDKNKSILEKLYSQTQKRRETSVAKLTDENYQKLLQASTKEKSGLKNLYDTFDAIATEGSPYYAQFKDSKWLKDYSNEDKLKDYAKLIALSQKYNDGVAITYLDRTMQNRVAKAQDWSVTGNTLKGVATTTISDLGSQVAMARRVWTGELWDPEAMALINQGLEPIYDKNGKIIGSKKNDNIWTNPAYWNDMYTYNTFSSTEMELIKQRGGVSRDINVREYGWNPNEHFLSFDTAYEGFKQGGHVIAAVAETGVGGVAGRVLGGAAKIAGSGSMTAAKFLGAGVKTLDRMARAGKALSKVGAKTHNFAMEALAATNGAQGEAMGTFNEQLENNKEAINNQIKKELKQYYNTINFNSKEAQNAINSIYKNLKAADNRRVKSSSGEGMRALPMSDKTLMQQAKQEYSKSLLSSKEKELTIKHKKDEQEAAINAAKTYMTNWAMDFGKEVLVTHGVKQFLVAKGAKLGNYDNTPVEHFMADVKTGGVKRAINSAGKEIKNLSARNVAKAAAKQVAGGFADEYFDGINANFSEAAGSNAFKQYINKQYDPDAYFNTVEGMYGNLIAGINGAVDGITNRENLYEGAIGAISPFTSVMPNVGSAFVGKDTWSAIIKGKDSKGNKINTSERIAHFINNPLLYEYAELRNKDKVVDTNIEAINKVVKAYKENGTIDDAAKAMAAASGYSSGYSNLETSSSAVMATEDNKLLDAFNLMSVAKTLESVNGGTKSALYGQTIERLKGLAENKLSDKEMEEEVTRFISDPDNKSILDNNTSEQARVIAEDRLKKNAQFFMDLYKKKNEIDEKLDNSPILKNKDSRVKASLEYQLLAKDNWKERLKTLEEETGVSYTDAEQEYNPNLELIYGSHTSRERALRARERDSQKIFNTQLELQEENIQSKKTIESLEEQLVNANTEDEKKDIQEKIDQEKILIKSRELRSSQLKVQQNTIKEECASLRTLIKDTKGKPVLNGSFEFSVNRILNSDARTRAEILNDANRGRYTKKQLAVIDKAKAKLTEKDPEALQKMQDAGELAHRVEDSNRLYNMLLDNSDLATAYFDAQEEFRNRKALTESLQEEIDAHYKELDNVLSTENPDDIDIRNAVSTWSSTLINTYMEDHPNSVPKLKSYYDLAKFDEDAASIIMARDEEQSIKENRFKSIMLIQSLVNNREELIKKLEECIDDDTLEGDLKDFLNDLLEKMQMLGYQRDATVVESREKKRKRKAEEKTKTETTADKNDENLSVPDDSDVEVLDYPDSLPDGDEIPDIMDDEEVPDILPDDVDVEDLITPDDEAEESDEPMIPADSTEEPETAIGEEGTVEKGTVAVDLGEPSFVNSIMSDEAEDGEVDAGEMWHNTSEGPRKETFIVNKKGKNITFSINGNKVALSISPKNYKSDDSKESKVFKASSMEKKDDGWYFNGTFAGSKEQIQVKANNNFDLEKAINTQKEANEKLYIRQDKGSSSQRVTTDAEGDTTVRSETLAEQVQALSDEEKSKQTITINDSTPDTATLNTVGDGVNSSHTVMSGNGMSEWKMGDKDGNMLDQYAILEHKVGAKKDDHMNQFYAWTNEQGWHIQNIIDRELGRILLANPKAKFKFMSVTNNDIDANTNDARVFTDWFLVLDYDESINKGITTLHDEKNGGVINTNGKRYLVVGTVYQKGGPNEATSRNLLFNTSKDNTGVKAAKAKYFGEESSEAQDGYGVIYKERATYRKEHSDERFFVSEKYSTEAVPNSLIPGYIVKRQEGDEKESHRPLSELLNDKERNPFGYTLETIPIAIQMEQQFFVNKKVNLRNVMFPRDPYGNMGAAFVLFPAGNGKYFCAHVDPLVYRELKEGSIKDKVVQNIYKLCSPDYDTRIAAIRELSNIFYFDSRGNKNGNFILTNKNSNTITFVNKGNKGMPIKITQELDSQVIFDAFEEMNPRVNITMFNLNAQKDSQNIKELDSMGALNLDLAQLALAGSSYSVYGVNLDGTINKPSSTEDFNPSSTPFDKNRQLVIYDNTGRGDTVQYTYNTETGKYTFDGEPLNEEKDVELIKQLEYNRKALNGSISFICRVHSDEYYIADSSTPLVVKINSNTHHVEELSKEESQTIIKKYTKAQKDKSREQAAVDMLEESFDAEHSAIPEEAENNIIDGYLEEEQKKVSKDTSDTFDSPDIVTGEPVVEGVSTISFTELFNNRNKFKKSLMHICKSKWPDFPKKLVDVMQYLKNKNINIDNIQNSDTGIQAFLDTIKNCRE